MGRARRLSGRDRPGDDVLTRRPQADIAETAMEIKTFLSSVLRTTGYQWHGG
jgi:hypothetical protein